MGNFSRLWLVAELEGGDLKLAFDVHIQTDYGDETGRLTPWDLFDEKDAREAYGLAQEAFDLADSIFFEVQKE